MHYYCTFPGTAGAGTIPGPAIELGRWKLGFNVSNVGPDGLCAPCVLMFIFKPNYWHMVTDSPAAMTKYKYHLPGWCTQAAQQIFNLKGVSYCAPSYSNLFLFFTVTICKHPVQ